MVWVIAAAIANAIWTILCAQLLPDRVATHFGLNGRADGWMSRRGFILFGTLFPIATAAFLVFVGGRVPPNGALSPEMERIATGVIVFFSFLSWTIVRSNRRSPAKMDYLGLVVSIAVLMGFVFTSTRALVKQSAKPSESVSSQAHSGG